MLEEKRGYLMQAIRHYRSLFSFPTHARLAYMTAMAALLGGTIAFNISEPSATKVTSGVLFATSIFVVPTLSLDFVMSRFITRKDLILDLRHLAALSLGTTILWMFVLNVWVAIRALVNSTELVQGMYFGMSVDCSFRFLVLRCVSSGNRFPLGVVAFLPPLVSAAVASSQRLISPPMVLAAAVLSTGLLVAVAEIFVSLVEQHGRKSVGIGALELFRAFLANWVVGLASPLEGYFEKMGSEANVAVKLLGFKGGEAQEATIVVPNVHPGPFRNLGSSNLPWKIQQTLQKKRHMVVLVPHGASGHEMDVTSRAQEQRILDAVFGLADFGDYSREASKMVRVDMGVASSTCQIIGKVAFVTLTCAPASMEDILPEVGIQIVERARALGIEEVILVDAHNSIGGKFEVPVLSDAQLVGLRSAAQSAIERALQLKRFSFSFGASQVMPTEFKIEHGIGPGGITTAVVDVEGQRTAYIVIDGNNMVSGLREKVLGSIGDLVDDGEVLTTDTHVVNAVSTIERGYSPIGESIDHGVLLSYIREGIASAREKAVVSSAAYRVGIIHGVHVIGETKLRNISLLVDSTLSLSKRLVAFLYAPAMIVSILLFVTL